MECYFQQCVSGNNGELANTSSTVAAQYARLVGETVALFNQWVLFGTTTIQHVDGTPQLI